MEALLPWISPLKDAKLGNQVLLCNFIQTHIIVIDKVANFWVRLLPSITDISIFEKQQLHWIWLSKLFSLLH